MNRDSLLLRQIHPTHIQEGRVTSLAFKPSAKDEGRLSTYNGDMITPKKAFIHYTESLLLQSIGIMALATFECRNLDLNVDPDQIGFPEHVSIDFSGKSGNQIEKIAKLLRSYAIERDWVYQP